MFHKGWRDQSYYFTEDSCSVSAYNSSSRAYNPLFWTLQAPAPICAYVLNVHSHIYTQLKIKLNLKTFSVEVSPHRFHGCSYGIYVLWDARSPKALNFSLLFLFFFCFVFFEIESHILTLAGLELPMCP